MREGRTDVQMSDDLLEAINSSSYGAKITKAFLSVLAFNVVIFASTTAMKIRERTGFR